MSQNGTHPDILVIDERPNGLRKDWSNINHPQPEVMEAVGASVGVLIRITNDGVWVDRGIGQVMLHETKTEAQESLEHAQEHKLARLGDKPSSEHDYSATMTKVFEALGTDEETQAQITLGDAQ